MLLIRCPLCNAQLQVAPDASGKTVRCPIGGHTFVVSTPNKTEPAVQVAATAPHPPVDPGLGAVEREFAPRSWRSWATFSAVVLIVSLPTAVLLRVYKHYGVALPATCLAVVSAVATMFTLCLALWAWKSRAWVCTGGLRLQGLTGRHEGRWDEIEAVLFQTDPWGPGRHTLLVRTRAGKELTVPGLIRKQYQLSLMLSERIKPLLWPGWEQALGRGETLSFGELVKVAGQELHWTGRPVAWSAVEEVRLGYRSDLGRSVLQLRCGDRLPDIETGSIPNLELLLQLLAQRFGVKVVRDTRKLE